MAVHKAIRSNPLAQLKRPGPNSAQILRPTDGLRISPAGSQSLQTRLHARKAAQLHPRNAKNARPDRRRPDRRHPDNQRKAEFLETLHHVNRGYGIALSALERLETKDRQLRPLIFPAGCLRDYRNRTEALRAVANRDLLRLLAGREERDAQRFDKARKRA